MRPHPMVVLLLAAAVATQSPVDEPRVVAPRTATDPELAPAMKEFRAMIAKDAGGQALLAAKELQGLREVTEFRKAVAARAPEGEVVITPTGEPGSPLVVRGRLNDGKGQPVAGALVYAYHTSAKGWYGERAPHFASSGGAGGDFGHARLFGYVRTDAQGNFVLHTIRPGGYPRSTLPEHIHWHASIDGTAIGGGEVWFDDDPRLTEALRKRAGRDVVVVKPEPADAGGANVVQPTLVVDPVRVPVRR